MGIVEEDIARVRAATDFVALVGEHVALRRVGSRWAGLCPFHSEKSASLSVNAEMGLYYCFGCGAKGDVITFVRETEHLDFAEAVEKLAARAGIALRYDDDATAGRDRQRKTRIHEALQAAIDWYHARLLSSPDAAAARAYLRRERGYDGEAVRKYKLGWAPGGGPGLASALGLPVPVLIDAGLITVDDHGRHLEFFRRRILFPIFDPGGRPIGAGGRILPGGDGPRGPKYKNTSNTAVYDKSRVLYGLHLAKKDVVEKGRVVVCEGYTDVIGLHEAGVGEAVATCGTALADGHIKLLTNFARRIVLAYDADNAGQTAAEKFYEWEQRHQVDVRVIALPPGADPADLARSDPAALLAAVEEARPYLGFRLERLFSRSDLVAPEGRARTVGPALRLIAEHPDALVRDQYVMELSDRCRVAADRLREMLLTGEIPAGEPPARTAQRPADRPESGPAGRADSAPAGRPAPAAVVSGPEGEALRLFLHRPAEMAGRMHPVLFGHAVARRAFELLAATADVHVAVEESDPQTADLIQRLAVEDTDAEPDDVVIRLVERAVQREMRDLQAEMRQARPEEQAGYVPAIAWLKTGLERMRLDDVTRRAEAVEAEERLVGWLAERHQTAVPIDSRPDSDGPVGEGMV